MLDALVSGTSILGVWLRNPAKGFLICTTYQYSSLQYERGTPPPVLVLYVVL